MLNTLITVAGAIITVGLMVLGALWKGEQSGRDKEKLRQAKENEANEKARTTIDSRVDKLPADKLHDGFYRD